MALDASGNAAAVWYAGDLLWTLPCSMKYSRRSGAGPWDSPAAIATPSGVGSLGRLSIESNGDILLPWQDLATPMENCQLSIFNAVSQTWGTPLTFETRATSCTLPAISSRSSSATTARSPCCTSRAAGFPPAPAWTSSSRRCARCGPARSRRPKGGRRSARSPRPGVRRTRRLDARRDAFTVAGHRADAFFQLGGGTTRLAAGAAQAAFAFFHLFELRVVLGQTARQR